MFKQYRLKDIPSVEVAVCRLTPQNARKLALFCNGLVVETVPPSQLVQIEIYTKKGYVRVMEGEFIVVTPRPFPKVEVLRPGIFNDKYEPIPVRSSNGS